MANVYLRKLSKYWGQISRIALVLDNFYVAQKLSSTRKLTSISGQFSLVNIKSCITTSHFMWTKMCAYVIWNKSLNRPCLLYIDRYIHVNVYTGRYNYVNG